MDNGYIVVCGATELAHNLFDEMPDKVFHGQFTELRLAFCFHMYLYFLTLSVNGCCSFRSRDINFHFSYGHWILAKEHEKKNFWKHSGFPSRLNENPGER